MYGAKLVTEGRFCALYAAAGAVDHFRRDRDPVELCPQGGSFFAQGIIVRERCDSGITFFAIQSAAAGQLVCVFHNLTSMPGIHSGLKAPPGILWVHDRALFDFGA